MDSLFYELIRVAIGTQEGLSRQPKVDEWGVLYMMAQKQSLVGVCFAALQRLGADADEGFAQIGMSEMQYLDWMSMAAQIQQKNHSVDDQCVELQKMLTMDGLKSSILKGQGVGQLYAEHLHGLRQSGDIDVYVDCGMKKALAYARGKYGNVDYDYVNAHIPFNNDIEVELHWTLQAMTNLFLNVKLQNWVKAHTNEILGGRCSIANNSIITPSLQINRFYILLHTYHHLTSSGVGFRQLMDYYFVLKQEITSVKEKEEINKLFSVFGMKKFAGAVMWIMQNVFGLEDKYLLCVPNELNGKFVLNEVLRGGNFGHHDERAKSIGSGKCASISKGIYHSFSMFSQYPMNAIWHPIWVIWHYFWKRTVGKY